MVFQTRHMLPLLLSLLLIFSHLVEASGSKHTHRHFHRSHRNAERALLTVDQSIHPEIRNEFDPLAGHLAARQTTTTTNSSGQTGGGSSSSSSTDFTCGPDRACGNGACCGESGWCGYGPTYCGTGCQSNCNATAEVCGKLAECPSPESPQNSFVLIQALEKCGQYAATANQTCPLNVCCSEYGFCGTTSDFCGSGCQSKCQQPKPSGAASNAQARILGYWEGWNSQHACGTMAPSEIPIEMLTHLNFAFGYISTDFAVTNMDGLTADLYQTITSLKERNPNLKVNIALGGWTFSDPGVWQNVYPEMVSSASNRATFIENLLGFLSEYGFDGVDFDWEYPGADDRGGSDSNGVDYTTFLKELRTAVKGDPHGYLITFTSPTSYWYLRHFDITAMTEYVDWINLMTYDLHGVWDRDNPIGNQVLAHTNLTEIDLALDLFWRNDIDPAKIVMGLGFYGRSFQLTDASCWKPGCLFSGAGDAGPCTATAGILSYKEITDIISTTGATPYVDETAAVNYLVYKDDNWISYDDSKTFKMKIDYANKMGLSGIMVWAIDLDNTNHDALKAISPFDANLVDPLALEDDNSIAIASSNLSPSSCFVKKECAEICDVGYTGVTRLGVDPTAKSFAACDSNHFRYLCCPSASAPPASTCHWAHNVTYSDCAGTCNVGQVKIAGDSWGWEGSLEDGHPGKHCLRGGAAFCCDAGNAQQYLNICKWSSCGGTCASEYPDHPFVQTTDTGGPTNRCPATGKGGIGAGTREYCCPRSNSLNNCQWHWGGSCSEQCPINQLEFDTDPNGDGYHGSSCYGSRQQSFCCDPPGGLNNPFVPVDLDKLFPTEYLPDPESVPKYDLVSFGGLAGFGVADPNTSGVAFFLIAGNSYAVSQLKRREGEPEPFTFIDCPANLRTQPDTAIQTARVVCLSNDLEGCFRVSERGVEGTIVEMPDNCGRGTWARAASLEISEDQALPDSIVRRGPTSVVYEFSFDYNLKLMRRDAGPTSVRMDYSNVAGYWNAVVDSSGIQSRSLNDLEDRYFSAKSADWNARFATLGFPVGDAKVVHEVVTNTIYKASLDTCPIAGDNYPEGFVAGVSGLIDANMFYGFSLIGQISAESFTVKEAAGFIHAAGKSDISFTVGGVGQIDISKINRGNPAVELGSKTSLGGHNIFRGWATFDPYISMDYEMGTSSGSGSSINFTGLATVRVQSDLGSFDAFFPDASEPQSANVQRSKNQISVADYNVLHGSDGDARIAVGVGVNLGLKVDLVLPSSIGVGDGNLPDISLSFYTETEFEATPGTTDGTSCLDYKISTIISQEISEGPSAGWSNGGVELANDLQSPDSGSCFQDATSTFSTKRQVSSLNGGLAPRGQPSVPGWPLLVAGATFALNLILPVLLSTIFNAFKAKLKNDNSFTCEVEEEEEGPCCGCICMDAVYVYRDIETCNGCNPDDGVWPGSGLSFPDTGSSPPSKRGIDPGTPMAGFESLNSERSLFVDDEEYHILEDRASGTATISPKPITICGNKNVYAGGDFRYPAFPADASWPWDGIEGGKFDPITKYWGNISADCSNWGVSPLAVADKILPIEGGIQVRAKYNTEHVFEGQLVGDFFDWWLNKGQVHNQNPPPANPQTIIPCFWTQQYVIGLPAGSNWQPITGGGRIPFIQYLLTELGSLSHLNRLTIYLARPNRMKGSMFSGNQAISPQTYSKMNIDDQLSAVKEFGMNFVYMNDPTVWAAFCGTYEAIYQHMGQFDTWYANNGQGGVAFPPLQAEWRAYIRNVLDSMVVRSRAAFDFYYATRKTLPPPAGLLYAAIWASNKLINRPLIRLSGVCASMDPPMV